MTILRIHKKQQNFVVLDKTCLNDVMLSWGAKGLHSYLMSLPDDWQVRVSDLRVRSKNGRDAVRGLLSELEQVGYIQRSGRRNSVDGRFGGIEYLVFETPTVINEEITPEPEKTVSVKNGEGVPRPEQPETGKPTPENTTLLSINRINNNKLNNKTAAVSEVYPSDRSNTLQQKETAAVDFLESVVEEKTESTTPPRCSFVSVLSQEDGLIDSQLTSAQKQRVHALVQSLNLAQKDHLYEEITFCLLNLKQFTVCGKDFSRKLNAIRKVILRGDWQTPTGMMSQVVLERDNEVIARQQLEAELKSSYAEVSHFKKLLVNAKAHTRAHIEPILHQVMNKIHLFESQLRQLSQIESGCSEVVI
jgi:hypothetical protein